MSWVGHEHSLHGGVEGWVQLVIRGGHCTAVGILQAGGVVGDTVPCTVIFPVSV